jgi:hypothetical protein
VSLEELSSIVYNDVVYFIIAGICDVGGLKRAHEIPLPRFLKPLQAIWCRVFLHVLHTSGRLFLLRRFQNVPPTSRRLFLLRSSGMFHQHEEESFLLKKETILDLCRTQEKVPEDSAY